VPLEKVEVFRKKMLFILGSLFALAGSFFLLGLGGRGWGFVLALPVVLIAWVLTVALRAEIATGLVVAMAKTMGLRLSPRGEFSLEGLVSGLSSSPDSYEAKDLVKGEVNTAPSTSSDTTPYHKVEATSNTVSIYQDINFFAVARYRFHLPFSVKEEVRFGPRGNSMGRVGLGFWVISAIFIGGSFLQVTVAVLFAGLDIQYALLFYIGLAIFTYLFFTSTIGRKDGLKRVELESPEFERLYDVYGEDQVEARKFLTPRIQEALVRLRKYLGRPVWGAAQGRNLWLLVGEKGRFPVPVLRPVSETLETWKTHYREELLEIFRVAEILKLEEEAKRRGAWRRKIFVGLNEFSSAPEKSIALDCDQPQQAEDTPTRNYKLFGR
jgi:hypothetical protein